MNTILTLAYVVFSLFIGFILSFAELWWLRKSAVGDHYFMYSAILIGVMNFVFIIVFTLCVRSYLILFVVPLPVLPALLVIVKLVGFFIIHRHFIPIPYNLFKFMAVISFIDIPLAWLFMFGFTFINPTYENIENAIVEKNNALLQVMLWIDTSTDAEKKIFLKSAMVNENGVAVEALLRNGVDPLDCLYERASYEMLWKVTQWRLDNHVVWGNICHEDQENFVDIIAESSLSNVQYALHQGFEPKNYRDIIFRTLEQHSIASGRATDGEVKELKEKISLLLKHGADINGAGVLGVPTVFALINRTQNLAPILEFMIDNGLHINSVNPRKLYMLNKTIPDGISPLAFAIINDHPQYIDILLKNGADVNAKDSNGLHAYNYAIVKHYDKTMLNKITNNQ
jgi:Ankyrin repeat